MNLVKSIKNTIAATCEPVYEFCIQVQETSNETDCYNVCVSKPKCSFPELSYNIQDVYTRSVANLHENERVSLQNLLVQYRIFCLKTTKL